MRTTIGWHELNDAGRRTVAEFYGYKTADEFEKSENFDRWPALELGEMVNDDYHGAGDHLAWNPNEDDEDDEGFICDDWVRNPDYKDDLPEPNEDYIFSPIEDNHKDFVPHPDSLPY